MFVAAAAGSGAPGGGAGDRVRVGELVAFWSEERAEAAAVAFAVAPAPGRTRYLKALTPYPVPRSRSPGSPSSCLALPSVQPRLLAGGPGAP